MFSTLQKIYQALFLTLTTIIKLHVPVLRPQVLLIKYPNRHVSAVRRKHNKTHKFLGVTATSYRLTTRVADATNKSRDALAQARIDINNFCKRHQISTKSTAPKTNEPEPAYIPKKSKLSVSYIPESKILLTSN